MKKPKLVLVALALLIGAASAAGPKLSAGPGHSGESAMLNVKQKAGS
jgi:hypothetical protein